jgi:hypothetical protein
MEGGKSCLCGRTSLGLVPLVNATLVQVSIPRPVRGPFRPEVGLDPCPAGTLGATSPGSVP